MNFKTKFLSKLIILSLLFTLIPICSSNKVKAITAGQKTIVAYDISLDYISENFAVHTNCDQVTKAGDTGGYFDGAVYSGHYGITDSSFNKESGGGFYIYRFVYIDDVDEKEHAPQSIEAGYIRSPDFYVLPEGQSYEAHLDCSASEQAEYITNAGYGVTNYSFGPITRAETYKVYVDSTAHDSVEYLMKESGDTVYTYKAHVGDDGNTYNLALKTTDVEKNNLVPVVDGYTVTFNTHGGSAVESQIVNEGDFATKPTPEPTKNGWKFIGWYVDPNTTSLYLFNFFRFDTTPITGDLTLHAIWGRDVHVRTYNLSNNDHYGCGEVKNSIGDYWVDSGYGNAVLEGDDLSVTISARPKAGYHFVKWKRINDDDSETFFSNSPTHTFNVTQKDYDLYATFEQSNNLTLIPAKATSCKESGNNAYYKCNDCGRLFKDKEGTIETTIEKETIKPISHSLKDIVAKKATLSQNGSIEKKCSACGKVESKTIIYYPKTITLSKTDFTYNKKVQKPTLTIKGSDGKAISSSNYTVTYSNNNSKKIGEYNITISFKGNYEGTKTLKYYINPKGTSLNKLTAGKKQFKVTWKKQTTETTGYEVQYATNKSFTSGKKTVKIKKNKTTTSTVKKLKAKKKYYVRIRTYKTVNGKKYCSGWSKVKNVTTKK